jgi:hypothetical protein
MKKLVFITLLVCVLFSCELPGADQAGADVSAERSVIGPYVKGPYMDGGSGVWAIEMYIHYAYSLDQRSVSVSVASDEVLVGGGAYAGPDTMLTASYPDWNDPDAASYCDKWVAECKEFNQCLPLRTYVYAVGMKLKHRDGVKGYIPKEVVQSCVYYNSSPLSEYAQHPVASVSCPKNSLIIGGGARVWYPLGEDGINIWGNYLTESMAEGVTWGGNEDGVVGAGAWVARSKDHLIASPARIQAYVISIKYDPSLDNMNIPYFGDMNVKCMTASTNTQNSTPGKISSFGTDPRGDDLSVYGAGWVFSGVGGRTVWTGPGWGRILTEVGYSWNSSSAFHIVRDRDYCNPDSGILYSQVFMIRPDDHGYGVKD